MDSEKLLLEEPKGAYLVWVNEKVCGYTISINHVYILLSPGVITRMDAEKLLLDEPKGAYLVRVSEKVWGYTISYRAIDRCKHFLIDASEDQYHFFGPNQLMHDSIIELVNYHKVSYVSILNSALITTVITFIEIL